MFTVSGDSIQRSQAETVSVRNRVAIQSQFNLSEINFKHRIRTSWYHNEWTLTPAIGARKECGQLGENLPFYSINLIRGLRKDGILSIFPKALLRPTMHSGNESLPILSQDPLD